MSNVARLSYFLRQQSYSVLSLNIKRRVAKKVSAVLSSVRRRTMLADVAAERIFKDKNRIYLASRPDIDFEFNLLPELRPLTKNWISDNLDNNAGDLPRLYMLLLNIRQAMEERIPGDFAELGVYRGNSAAVLAHFARQNERTVFLFDTFAGFELQDLVGTDAEKPNAFLKTSLDLVKKNVGTSKVVYVQGYFPQSVTSDVDGRTFAVVHLDCDLYEPMKAGLEFFYPRLSAGGMLIIHDYANPYWDGAKRAVDEFLPLVSERLVLAPDKSGTAILRKAIQVP